MGKKLRDVISYRCRQYGHVKCWGRLSSTEMLSCEAVVELVSTPRTLCRVPALEMLLHTASVLPDSDENAKHSKPLPP
jgi:hypothetical protein